MLPAELPNHRRVLLDPGESGRFRLATVERTTICPPRIDRQRARCRDATVAAAAATVNSANYAVSPPLITG